MPTIRNFEVANIVLGLMVGLHWIKSDAQTIIRKSFQGEIQDTISSSFETKNLGPMFFPKRGEVLVTTEKWCGDDDVVHYYSQHPDEDYLKGSPEVNLVLGFFTAPGNIQNPVPSVQSWLHLATAKIASHHGHTKKMMPTFQSQEVSTASILQSSIGKILETWKKQAKNKSDVSVYFLLQACRQWGINQGNQVSDQPTALDLSSQLQQHISSIEHWSSSLSASDINRIHKIRYRFDSSGKLEINEGPQSTTVTLPSWMSSWLNVNYPQKSDPKVKDLRDVIRPFEQSILGNYQECQSRWSNPQSHYWWEYFAYENECELMRPLHQLWQEIFLAGMPDEAPLSITLDQFRNLKLQIAQKVVGFKVLAAIYRNFDQIANKHKTACFPASGKHINNILASLAVPLEQRDTEISFKAVGRMSHPEPLYALGQAAPYQQDWYANFMPQNPNPQVMGIRLQPGKSYNLNINGLAMHFHLHMRDAGCHDGPIYCLYPSKKQLFSHEGEKFLDFFSLMRQHLKYVMAQP